MSTSIEQRTAFVVGTVDSVAPDKIGVLLDLEAPQSVALNGGQPIHFPRVNSSVLIPNESGALVGLIAWIGVERSAFPKRTGLKDFGLVDLPFPLRRMTLTPLGTLRRTEDGFDLTRGVVAYPSVGDDVQLPTGEQLRALVEATGDKDRRVVVGHAPLASDAPVSVDPDKLFGRHIAVLGNTGSGKSCSVAGLIRWSLAAARDERKRLEKTGPPNARFIVLDPNGEYRATFGDISDVRVFRVGETEGEEQSLRVPAWIWNSQEWSAFALAQAGVQRPLLMRTLRQLRAGVVPGAPEPVRVAASLRSHRSMLATKASSPANYMGFPANKNCGENLSRLAENVEIYQNRVPDSREQLAALYQTTNAVVAARRWQNGNGFDDFSQADLERVIDALDAVLETLPAIDDIAATSEDAPLPFEPSELPGHLELLSLEDSTNSAAFVANLVLRIRSMLADARLKPIVAPSVEMSFEDWLNDYVGAEGANNGQVAVLDLSLVPSDVLHMVIAVAARVVFEALQRYRKLNGMELPTVLVLEEAHTFVNRGGSVDDDRPTPGRICRETFERIAREGRKFGLGLMLSSQRPSELSPTVLAQCNTFLLHRLVNDQDQNLVGRLVPDNLGGLLAELPSLPSQQAILLGWATPIPVLVHMNHLPIEHRPRSADPAFWEVWSGEQSRPLDWKAISTDWTSGY